MITPTPQLPCVCGCHDTQDGYVDAGNASSSPEQLCSNCRDPRSTHSTETPAVGTPEQESEK